MSVREHHVAGHAPDYTRRAQGFRNLDGSPPDRRPAPPAYVPSRLQRIDARLRRLRRWALNQIHPDPRERRVIYTYLLVATWGVMVAIGILAAHGVHP